MISEKKYRRNIKEIEEKSCLVCLKVLNRLLTLFISKAFNGPVLLQDNAGKSGKTCCVWKTQSAWRYSSHGYEMKL